MCPTDSGNGMRNRESILDKKEDIIRLLIRLTLIVIVAAIQAFGQVADLPVYPFTLNHYLG